MANKMLIDSTHPEETRVVVLRGNRVEEFDFESANRRQLRGNIYLAKVTRVEPSLQAAFVDYGGNRHGFLAFSEIHPDYYQIPVADRQALIAEEERAHRDAEDEIDRRASGGGRSRRPRREAAHERHDATRSEAGASDAEGGNGEHEGRMASTPRRTKTPRKHHEHQDAAAESAAEPSEARARAGRPSGRAAGRRGRSARRTCSSGSPRRRRRARAGRGEKHDDHETEAAPRQRNARPTPR